MRNEKDNTNEGKTMTINLTPWSKIGLPKSVSSRITSNDPYRYSATATINHYGETIEGSGTGDTRSKAIAEAKRVAAEQV